MFQLDPSLDSSDPVLMYNPQEIKTIEWIKYYDTTAAMYKYVTIIPLTQFLDFVNGYSTTESNVETMSFTVNSESFNFKYRNDIQPKYCTVISNYYIIFDAFDNTLDDTLQASKTQCYGLASPVWLMEDDFIPPLDDAQVPLLLNEAKSLAFVELKQTSHNKAEQEARRQWNTLQKDKSIDNKPSYFDQLPNFGRRSMFQRAPYIVW